MAPAKLLTQSPVPYRRTTSGLRTKAIVLPIPVPVKPTVVMRVDRSTQGLAYGMLMTPVGAAIWYALFRIFH